MANVQDVAKFFINLAQQGNQAGLDDLMTDLRLQKLLYFAQGWHLARYGKPLFDAPIEAWKLGPVVPEVYQAYKINCRNGITSDARVACDAFTEEERSLLFDVVCQYEKDSTGSLVQQTHLPGTPWRKVIQADGISSVMDTESIRAYFAAQPPLPSLEDDLEGIPVEVPRRNQDGVIILPREEADDWSDDRAGV